MTFVTLPSRYLPPKIAKNETLLRRFRETTGAATSESLVSHPDRNASKTANGGARVRRRHFMTMRVQASLILFMVLAMMGLASCDHYNCASGANLEPPARLPARGSPSGGLHGSAASAFVFAGDSSWHDRQLYAETAKQFAATLRVYGAYRAGKHTGGGYGGSPGQLYLYAVYYDSWRDLRLVNRFRRKSDGDIR